MSEQVTHKRSSEPDTAACGAQTYDGAVSWANVTCRACLDFRPEHSADSDTE